MDDLISRKAAVSRISDLLMLELRGKRIPTWNEVYNAIGDIPAVHAVPLDKLCDWLPLAVHSCPANPEGHNEKCEHMKCEECWKEAICNWMEEDNANQT